MFLYWQTWHIIYAVSHKNKLFYLQCIIIAHRRWTFFTGSLNTDFCE
jgi:hypothetical protein